MVAQEERSKRKGFSRRQLLAGAAGLAAVSAAGTVMAQDQTTEATSRVMGTGADELGECSAYEQLERLAVAEMPSGPCCSLTPLGDLDGIITPSDLHYEVHHTSMPEIDPAEYKLLVHGLVERPMVFTLDALKRFPRVSRIAFLECSGNSLDHFLAPDPSYTAQIVAGLASCSQWIGVPLTTIFREVGVLPEATWAIFEGSDSGLMTRSWPMEKLWHGEALLAYGQNGEALRPPQGYPVRLLVPGSEGNSNVKWLRRIEVTDKPKHSAKETFEYSDINCNEDGECVVNQFTFTMDAKSVITWPSGGQTIPEPGVWEISGIAWSGRGTIAKVEISTDGGETWNVAGLDEPVLPKAFTRFRYLWDWDGGATTIMSRAIDETGYVQPTREELLAWGRSQLTYYHSNAIFRWDVAADGSVMLGDVA